MDLRSQGIGRVRLGREWLNRLSPDTAVFLIDALYIIGLFKYLDLI